VVLEVSDAGCWSKKSRKLCSNWFPCYFFYTEPSKRQIKDDLKDIDLMVLIIQDVGARFYILFTPLPLARGCRLR
jgi:uncharacterized protein YbbC (DUF1343 family)